MNAVPMGTDRRLSRITALFGAVGTILATLIVLVELVTVTGDPRQLVYPALGAFFAATLFARYVRPRVALGVGVSTFVVGLIVYLLVAGIGYQPRGILADLINFATGMSVLEIQETTTWSLSVTPAPVFLTWYFALRRRYGVSALVGSLSVGFFVLTGDASPTVTLLGVASVTVVLGFGDLEGNEGTVRTAEYLLPILALMVLTPLFVSIVPGGAAPSALDRGGGNGFESAEDRTLSGAVVETGDDIDVAGSIRLSADVQFTVQAEQGRYWRTGSYDRYTGDGWIKAANAPAENELRAADGSTARVNQTFLTETETTTMPAAFRPVAFESESIDRSEVETGVTLRPERPLTEGETYNVSSSVPDPSPDELRTAGTDYPTEIEERYTQLPSDYPDRVDEATEELVADADDPYAASVTIEQYLRENKEYSLDVEEPEGDVADTFLFEMEAGYCTYFATTMVTMLRSQGIPARMAVGYSTGQQIANDTWVVRGYNAHTWVEVYFPDSGWVAFDPTPQGPLIQTQAEELENVRTVAEEFDRQEFDTQASWSVPPEGIEPEAANASGTQTPAGALNATEGGDIQTESPAFGIQALGNEEAAEGNDGAFSSLPPFEEFGLVIVVTLGAVAGARRSLYVQSVLKRVRVRYLSRTDPETDIEHSFERMLLILERRYRKRDRGETVREYLADIDPDPRAHRVLKLRERARYRGEISEAMAAEATRLVDDVANGR